jgi:catechol 2,3-dioxygenase-like lactoylglutathione lyase family enzyme
VAGGASSDGDLSFQVTGIDHVVLNVADVERSVSWYRDVLGLPTERLDEWRRGEAPFVSMRVSEGTIIDLFGVARSGENADHVALVVDGVDLEALAGSGRVEVVDGPHQLFGARGTGTGLYVRDPDGNKIELRTYP